MIDTERDSRTPWTPPGLRLPRVGDRVRLLARPECEYCSEWHDGPVGRLGEVAEIGHDWDTEPLTPELASHWYWVRFDGDGDTTQFAAIELEILADDDGGVTP